MKQSKRCHILPKWYLKKLIKPGFKYYCYKLNTKTNSFNFNKPKIQKQGISSDNPLFWRNKVYGELENATSKIDNDFKNKYDSIFKALFSKNCSTKDVENALTFVNDFRNYYSKRTIDCVQRNKFNQTKMKSLIGSKEYMNSAFNISIFLEETIGSGTVVPKIIENKKRQVKGFSDQNVVVFCLDKCIPEKNVYLFIYRIDIFYYFIGIYCPKKTVSHERLKEISRKINLDVLLKQYENFSINNAKDYICWHEEIK